MMKLAKVLPALLGLVLFLMSAGAAQADALLYALKDNSGTSIFRYSVNGDNKRLFSDHDTPIAIYELESSRRVVAAKGRVFAYGKPRKPAKADYFPSWEPSYRRERHHTYIYELSVDGRNAARKITEVLGTQSPRTFLVSPDARHIAYLNSEWWRDEQDKLYQATYIYIHDTRTGELKHKIDSGLRVGGDYTGITWLDENRIYLWRMPVIDVHLAEDQDTSKPIGPFVVDIRDGKFTALDRQTMMTMIEKSQRHRKESAPLCSTALNKTTLLCQGSSLDQRRDEKCTYASRKNIFFYDLEKNIPKRIYQSDHNCKDNWRLSPSRHYLASLSYYYRLKEMHIWVQELEQKTVKTVAKTTSPSEWLYIIDWETN